MSVTNSPSVETYKAYAEALTRAISTEPAPTCTMT
jgi:hypothetical protein